MPPGEVTQSTIVRQPEEVGDGWCVGSTSHGDLGTARIERLGSHGGSAYIIDDPEIVGAGNQRATAGNSNGTAGRRDSGCVELVGRSKTR